MNKKDKKEKADRKVVVIVSLRILLRRTKHTCHCNDIGLSKDIDIGLSTLFGKYQLWVG